MFSTDLSGLVLAGGHSSRMGFDKSEIIYDEKPHKYHTADRLKQLGLEVFISQRKQQSTDAAYQFIFDSYENVGPIGGLLACYSTIKKPVLVVACDYYNIHNKHIEELISKRDSAFFGTFLKDENDRINPLFGIYEVALFKKIKKEFENENYALYKILEKHPISTYSSHHDALQNINSSEEYDRIRRDE